MKSSSRRWENDAWGPDSNERKMACCLLTSREILKWLQEGRRQITQGAWPQTRPRLLQETRKLVCKSQGAVWAELRKMDFVHSSKDHAENVRRINPSGLRVQAVSLFLCRMGPDLCWVPRKSFGELLSSSIIIVPIN